MARIFWDTNLFIYLFEQNAEWAPRVVELREKMLTRSDQLLTSWLTVSQVLTKPKELRNTVLAKSYLDSFQSGSLELIPFDFEAAQRYSEICSRERVRPADPRPPARQRLRSYRASPSVWLNTKCVTVPFASMTNSAAAPVESNVVSDCGINGRAFR
jgi:uncharacterized protein